MRPAAPGPFDANAPRQIERLLREHPPVRTGDGGKPARRASGSSLVPSEGGGVARLERRGEDLVARLPGRVVPGVVPPGSRVTTDVELAVPHDPEPHVGAQHGHAAADESCLVDIHETEDVSDALVRFHLERSADDEVPAQFEGDVLGRVEAQRMTRCDLERGEPAAVVHERDVASSQQSRRSRQNSGHAQRVSARDDGTCTQELATPHQHINPSQPLHRTRERSS